VKGPTEAAKETLQVQLLVWIFVIRVIMLVAAAAAYFINGAIAKAGTGMWTSLTSKRH